MTCDEMIERIHARGRFSGKAGLHRMCALMKALGDPQDQLKYVHVAGTNGKGSTCTMIASILQESGYRVGLYTSPYLVKFHERIVVNGEMISDDDLIRLAQHTENTVNTLTMPEGEHIGEFEFVTAIAFQYFLEQKCDIVVLEVGLGGSFDATNVIQSPEVAVLTSISYDHMAVLGDSLEEIARTKAGIMKPGSPVVCYREQNANVKVVLREMCPDIIFPEEARLINYDGKLQTFTYKNSVYATTLRGKYQIQNAATALETVKVLNSRGFKCSENAIENGILNAKISARMEVVSDAPLIIIDGGHNEDGVRATVETLYEDNCKDYTLVVGMVADKAVESCIKLFASVANRMIITQPANERALPAKELAVIARKYCSNICVFDSLSESLDNVLKAASSDDKIVICGSLYLAGEAKEYFAKRQSMTISY